MTRRATNIMFFLVSILGAAVPARGQVRVVAQVDTSSTIYVGQDFSYYIIIDGDNRPGQVDLTPLRPYNPRSAGNRDMTRAQISIVNGRTTRNETKRLAMAYALKATGAGTIRLPSVTVTLDGQSYRTNPVSVTVVEPGTTDKLDLEVTLSERQCYVGQPVTLTVRFYVDQTADVGDLQFDVPAFQSDDFAVEDSSVIDPQATQYRLGSGVAVHVSQQAVTHEGRQMTQVSFSKLLIPKRSGPIDIEGSSALAQLATGRVRTGDFFEPIRTTYERFAARSDPMTLDVLPLPQTDKPREYYGLVGKYTISASASPLNVNVGDPITLTIRVGGNSYLKPVQWPDLESVPELAEDFRIPAEKASPVVENGQKVFTQTVRANSDSVTEIPPIPLAYFDPDSGSYVVAQSEAIVLEVAPTKVLTTADVEGPTGQTTGRDVQAIREGFSANYDGYDLLANQRFLLLQVATRPAYLLMWAIPLAALLASAAFKTATRTSPEAVARKRKRQACSRALKQLQAVESEEPQRRPELIVTALKTYIGQRLDRVAGSLTADDCHDAIVAATDDAELADRFRAEVVQLEAARYASVEANVDADQIEEAIALVRKVEKEL